MLAEHDENRGRQSSLRLAQEREKNRFLQVDMAAQRADRAQQRLPIRVLALDCRGELRDPFVDLAVLPFQSRRQRLDLHVRLHSAALAGPLAMSIVFTIIAVKTAESLAGAINAAGQIPTRTRTRPRPSRWYSHSGEGG